MEEKILERLLERFEALAPLSKEIWQAYFLLRDCYRKGGKVLVCGNGGSAADAEHIVGELMKGFIKPRKLNENQKSLFSKEKNGEYLSSHLQNALPALALTGHIALSTAFSNDIAADMVFAQQIYGYGKKDDVLIAITTSGNSKNIINAIAVANCLGIKTLGITGENGGKLRKKCEICLCLPESETFAVQELCLPLYHALCAMLEETFF